MIISCLFWGRGVYITWPMPDSPGSLLSSLPGDVASGGPDRRSILSMLWISGFLWCRIIPSLSSFLRLPSESPSLSPCLCHRESLRSSVRESVTLLIVADRQLLLTSRRRLFDLNPISTAINYQWIESWCNLSTLSVYTRRTAPLANRRCDFIRSDQWRWSAHTGGWSQKPLAHNLSDPLRSLRGVLWALTAGGDTATTPDSPEICCKLANNAGACNVCSRMLGVN